MGLNTPIELKLTDAGTEAKDQAESIIFTRFVAGSEGGAYLQSVVNVKQEIPINSYIKRLIGDAYVENGIAKIADSNSLVINGFANSLDADNDYILNEIGLMAKLTDEGEEFCFAYDYSNMYKYKIRIDRSQPISIQYKMILSRVPEITVLTSETGVTFGDFNLHTNSIPSTNAVHGIKFDNGLLTINNQTLDKSSVGLSNVDNTSDLNKPVSTAVQNAINGITLSSLGAAAAIHSHSTSDITGLSELAPASHTHVEADITDLGSYASSSHTHTTSDITDASTELAAKSHTHTESDITDLGSYATTTDLNTYGISNVSFDALTQVLTLTMKDGNTKTTSIPASAGNGETVDTIVYDDANDRLIFTMSDNSIVYCDITDLVQAIGTRFDNLDTITYNDEWVERMTGSGTSADPYLIYTPRDFMKINNDLTAHYKLMNNLDFSNSIGITIEINNEGYTLTTVNNEAPLFNSGEGYWPIGYNGYYPCKTDDNTNRSLTWVEALANGIYSVPINSKLNGITNNIYIFIGELNGNNKTIKGIVSNPTNTYSIGLFSFLGDGANIHNFTIKDSCFILNDVYVATGKYSAIGSVAGFINYITDSLNKVEINHIYNYATLINNRSTESDDCYTGGIVGFHDSTNPGMVIDQCSNHGALLYTNQTPHHTISGISNAPSSSTSNNIQIKNCINTSSLDGYYTCGIAYGTDMKAGPNINCGIIDSYYDSSKIFPITSKVTFGSSTTYQFSIEDTYNDTSNSTIKSNNDPYLKYPTSGELKSSTYITYINSLLSEITFVYNDLNVNNGWPLLVDEYNSLNGIDGNLNIAVVDPTHNKLYKSGYSVKNLQSLASFKEINNIVNAKIESYSDSNFGSMKIVNLTLAAADWDGSTSTQTKTVTGITATSPVQLLTELNANVEIDSITTDSVTFSCSSIPSSDINISVMFTA